MQDWHSFRLPPDLKHQFAWLNDDRLQRICQTLDAIKKDCVKFVGGCVRDSFCGEVPEDFDLATQLTPPETIQALEQAGIRAIPTGIEHGTVTAVIDHTGFEITTLRSDISTDGRRADVQFTNEWSIDAARRDFTINAIYVSPDGRVYDPFSGIDDLKTRIVRFIGDPVRRIEEDYLRILRFFRFSARFSEVIDQGGLDACVNCKSGIELLSAERIGSEIQSILRLPRASIAIRQMSDAHILKEIWYAEPDIVSFERMTMNSPQAEPPLSLASLYVESAVQLCERLRFSNAEIAICQNAVDGYSTFSDGLSARALRRICYQLGDVTFDDALLLARAVDRINAENFHRYSAFSETWHPPRFPLQGRDVLEFGVAPGPSVAKILKNTEARWIDEDFPNADRLQAILSDAISAEN